jgi:hypothetical protein
MAAARKNQKHGSSVGAAPCNDLLAQTSVKSFPHQAGHPQIFNYVEVSAPTGSAVVLCRTKAKIEAGKTDLQGVLVRLPLALRRRIEEKTTGSLSVTLCALAEYALNNLENDQKGIEVTIYDSRQDADQFK